MCLVSLLYLLLQCCCGNKIVFGFYGSVFGGSVL